MKPFESHPLHALAPLAAAAAIVVLAAACSSSSGNSNASPGSSSSAPAGSSTSAAASSGNAGGGGYGGGKTTASTTTTGAATVAIMKNPRLGQILADGRGRTLYIFLKDRGTTSSCSAECAKVWPPFTTSGKPRPGTGAAVSLLGTTSRSDGTKQVIYNGHPLYYYATDTRSGQTAGEGLKQFGAEWYALSPQGRKVEKGRS